MVKTDFADATGQKSMDKETTKAKVSERLQKQREAERDKDRGGR